MTISSLPLCYCSNVHPGRSLAEVLAGMEYAARVRRDHDGHLAAGLWLSRSVADELRASPDSLARFADRMAALDLTCHTLNAFPYGDFHGERVKEQVYRPDWSTDERLRYTLDCAAILARLLAASDPETDGTISTLPLGFKQCDQPANFFDLCCDRLVAASSALHEIEEEIGRTIRLAIEPEPFCLLETTDEAISFFEYLWRRAGDAADSRALERVRRHIGLCYDVCHQAVEFEEPADSIHQLSVAGVRIDKVHLTCALRLKDPGSDETARTALADFAEPRYLHQTTALGASGEILRHVDLTPEFAIDPPPGFRDAREWRVHFHVPVNAEAMGPLGTTRDDLRVALAAVARLDHAPHLEVETYTWSVLPGEKIDLVESLGRELRATSRLLDEIRTA